MASGPTRRPRPSDRRPEQTDPRIAPDRGRAGLGVTPGLAACDPGTDGQPGHLSGIGRNRDIGGRRAARVGARGGPARDLDMGHGSGHHDLGRPPGADARHGARWLRGRLRGLVRGAASRRPGGVRRPGRGRARQSRPIHAPPPDRVARRDDSMDRVPGPGHRGRRRRADRDHRRRDRRHRARGDGSRRRRAARGEAERRRDPPACAAAGRVAVGAGHLGRRPLRACFGSSGGRRRLVRGHPGRGSGDGARDRRRRGAWASRGRGHGRRAVQRRARWRSASPDRIACSSGSKR